MKERFLSLFNLGWYFALHLAKMVFRLFGVKAPGIERFRQNYEAEGVFSLSPAARERYPFLAGCIGCGLCRISLDIRSSGGASLSDPESLSLCLSRSMPDLEAARQSFHQQENRLSHFSRCPRGVPLPAVYDFIHQADKEQT